MSAPPTDMRAVLQSAYLEIKGLRSRLAESEEARSEPIAVIGLGCRFPAGVTDAETFWSALHDGVDAVRSVPPDRWDNDAFFDADPDAPGKLYTRHGSFLDRVDLFDPEFFGISPVEATSMDPQQRLLLEVAWEALENAGIAPDSLRASRTGVFVGLMYQDYLARQLRDLGAEGIGPYLGTGTQFSAAAGRLSYILGLQGPSVAIDTACSSSLVSVHLACQSLRNRECDIALAGGANVILMPEGSINMSKARMMSATGRCRTFDAAADGYTRGEGCGLVVLKRLSRAREDGDRILGLIRGSAVNQDGRSSGLTAPNGSAQRTLLRETLAMARVQPEEVGYVECHGTGTPLGDPIEVSALADIYGKRPADRPLAIGSVKTNFGHLESAAGICGLIKTLLVLRHREVPPHLHLRQLNPHIRLEGKPVVIPTEATPWFGESGLDGPRRIAAVSAFGFAGTIAHAILEAWDEPVPVVTPTDRGAHLLTLSAANEPALLELCQRFEGHLASNPDANLGDICFTANTGRAHQKHRLAVVASSVAEMKAALADVAATSGRAGQTESLSHKSLSHTVSGVVPPDRTPHIAFVFGGQGSQYAGAGRRLYETEPLFREALDRCEELLRPHLDRSMLSLLFAEPGSQEAALLDQTRYAQPVLLSLEYALYEQWKSWGIEPAVLLGHSVGEYAAACAAGIFSIEDALRLIAARGRLMQELPAGGGMAAVFASEEWARQAINGDGETVALAAVNAPQEIVLSGSLGPLRRVLDRARSEGLHVRELTVSHAFHSPLMRPMLESFREALAGVTFQKPTRPLVSSVTGRAVDGDEMSNAQYWFDHVLAPVRFRDAVETLRRRGGLVLLEIGAGAIVAPLAARTLNDDSVPALPSLRPGRDDGGQMLDSLARLHVAGAKVDWTAYDRPFVRRRQTLPTYPFQRERFWIKPSALPAQVRPVRTSTHLLGERLPQAPHQPDTFVWEADVDRNRRAYLFEHKLLGNTVWPISAQIELALAAAREVLGVERCRITSLEFLQTLHGLDRDTQSVQTVLVRNATGGADLRIYSRIAEGEWTLNTKACVEAEFESSHLSQVFDGTDRTDGTDGTKAPLTFSMMFFAAREDDRSQDRYRLILEAARYADARGFRGVWVPERHFTHMGSLYPNPSVLHAALARETKQVRLMAGSVVMPLHHPIRVAEEWAMVDNLSNGRVGLSLASGWNPDDFVLAPGKYDERYDDLYRGFELLQKLWRGESFETTGASGKTKKLRIYPTPVQPELPLWITAARSPETFRKAGALGANVLTHLLDQDIDGLAEKIALYREARAAHGFDPEAGLVTVMCHTFLAADAETVHRLAKKPFCEYLKASKGLMSGLAYARGKDVDIDALSEAELDDFAGFLYDRFGSTRALIGTPEKCLELANALQDAGVSEVACLLDFGPSTDEVLEHLQYLDQLRADHAAQGGRVVLQPVLEVSASAAPTESRGHTEALARCGRVVPADSFYRDLAAAGVEFNGGLRIIREFALGDGEAVAEVRLTAEQAAMEAASVVHPLLLEACMHTALAAMPQGGPDDPIRVPTGARSIRVLRPVPAGSVWSHARQSAQAADGSIEGDVTVYGADGGIVLELEGLKVKSIARPVVADETADWFYEVAWRPIGWPEPRPDGGARRWIVLEDECGVGAEWEKRDGDGHLYVRAGQITERIAPNRWTLSRDGVMGFARLFRETDLAAYDGIIDLWPLDGALSRELDVARLTADQSLGVESVTALVQALAQTECRRVPKLWIVTRGAQPVVTSAKTDVAIDVSQSPLWGFAGALAREHQEWWGGIVDLDPAASTERAAQELDRLLRAGDAEDQLALRGGERLVRRVIRSSAPAASIADKQAMAFRDDSAYLIVGGLGGLGLGVAQWMAGKGARHLVLMGRSAVAPDSVAAETIRNLEQGGVTVTHAQVDAASEARLTSFFAAYDGPPLRGVVHTAGVFHDESLLRLDRDVLWKAMGAKLSGAWALHRLLPDLDFFVLFSSFSALTPPRGQANYAAGCAFIDALAHHRRACGLPALSINWGAWSEVGFAATPAGREAHAQLEAMGMRRMTPQQGLSVLGRLMSVPGPAQVAVFPMDVREMAAADPALQHAPLLSELTSAADAASESATLFLHTLRQIEIGEQREFLHGHLARIVSSVMEIPPARLDVAAPLTQLGLDSLIAVNLKNRIQKETGLNVPLINALRGASVSSMADDLMLDFRVNSVGGTAALPPVAAGAQQELRL